MYKSLLFSCLFVCSLLLANACSQPTTQTEKSAEATKEKSTDAGNTEHPSPKDDNPKEQVIADLPTEKPVTPEPTPETPGKDEVIHDNPTNKCDGSETIVRFKTSDGVELEADYFQSNSRARGAVILFHMIPPSWNRTSYPAPFRKALQQLNLNVLNVDRRGAGKSQGKATDAYTGPTARLDVEAAVRFLSSAACKFDNTKILLIGASNGTTSVFDYTVNRSDKSLPDPKALIWLSPGSYTENQNRIDAHLTSLKTLPILFVYPPAEAAYNKNLEGKSSAWSFLEIPNGLHGTQNFDNGSRQQVMQPALEKWVKDHIGQ